jgi:hypothetical protein
MSRSQSSFISRMPLPQESGGEEEDRKEEKEGKDW